MIHITNFGMPGKKLSIVKMAAVIERTFGLLNICFLNKSPRCSFEEDLYCPRKILIKSGAHLISQKNPRWLDNVNTSKEYQEALRDLRQ